MLYRRLGPCCAVVLLAACSTGGDSDQLTATSAGVVEATPLAADEYAASCLTETSPGAVPSVIRDDLCIGDLSGDRRIIREDIDGGVGLAVSPDGRQTAFVDDGSLRIINVDGTSEVPLDARGERPEWLSADEIAFIPLGGRSVDVVEVADQRVSTVVDAAVLEELGQGWSVESISARRGSLCLSLYHEVDQAFLLVSVNTETGDVETLIGPQDQVIQDGIFSPDGSSVAYSTHAEVRVLDLQSGDDRRISPTTWVGVTPTWSPDGSALLWLANEVEGPQGPAALVIAPINDPDQVRIILSNEGGALDQFPAFPRHSSRPS